MYLPAFSYSLAKSSNNVKEAKAITPTKTHAGTYTGVILGGLGSAMSYMGDKFAKSAGGGTTAKGVGALAILTPLILNTALGTLIDHIRNKRFEKFAENTKGMTAFQAVEKDENAELTPKGNPYIKAATGKKYGALTLAILNPIHLAAKAKAMPSVLVGTISAVSGAIGGLVFGAIVDYFSNKTARNTADANPYPKTEAAAKQ